MKESLQFQCPGRGNVLGRNPHPSPLALASQHFPRSISKWENGTGSPEGNVHLIIPLKPETQERQKKKKTKKEER